MTETKFAQALFSVLSGPNQGDMVAVQFNPATLQRQVSNSLEKGKGDKTKQYVSQSSAKLQMELVFDTTHSGEDVCAQTGRVARLMDPGDSDKKDDRVPAVVEFEWGTFAFKGMVESFQETIDYFAPEGVPLRSTVKLTLVNQDKVFEDAPGPSVDRRGEGDEPVLVPDASPTDLGSRGGDPRSARDIAAANGLDSLRFGAGVGASLGVGGGVQLGAAAGFAAGATARAGASLGGGLSVGVSAGLGGGGASAGLDLGKLRPSAGLGIGANVDVRAGFEVGGRARVGVGGGSTSLRADVGQSAGLGARLRIEQD